MSQFLLSASDPEPIFDAVGADIADHQPPAMTRALLWSIGGFTALIIAWAAVARVDETATAHGRVVPQRQLQVLGTLEGGTVTAILVRPGQRIAAGAPLLRLDPGNARADFGRGSAAADALAARIIRLEAEVAGNTPVFPAKLHVAAPMAVAAEQGLWLARQSDRTSAAAGASARIEAAARALAEAEAAAITAAEVRAQAAREAAMLAPLVDKGIEPRMSLDRARSASVQAEASNRGAVQAVARARAGLAEARAAGTGAGDRRRVETGNELALARAELAGQSAGLPVLQSRVDRTEVRSPVSGIVQRVLVATIGGSVAPGASLVEIVPAGGAIVVEARVRPRDIGFVRIGQAAAVKLTAYDSTVFGSLKGQVTQISPDAIVDERGGEGWYGIRVETPVRSLTAPDGSPLRIGAGMVAEVDLLGRKRTILSYLLNPVTKLAGTAFRER